MKQFYLPEALRLLLSGRAYTVDDVGRSDSDVLIYSDSVLKIRKATEETETEYKILRWIGERIPVPKLLHHEVAGGLDYLLMSRVEGEMACSEANMVNPAQLVQSLADALKALWSVDVSQCPANWCLERKLSAARRAVDAGEVDVENAEPETFGNDGFRDPAELLAWLWDNRPKEDFVFSHGDFCLPNIFLKNGILTGVIDLGRAGIADRWQDIALCYRSLAHNFGGKYGGKVYDDFDPCSLFDALGIQPDWKKLKYYILLDELF